MTDEKGKGDKIVAYSLLGLKDMAIDPQQFWGSNYYNHPPLSDAMVREAERRLGVVLPAEFVALLRIQNGGYTKGFVHPMKQQTTWAEDHVPLHDLAG